MNLKSLHIQARLHPDKEHEAKAIKVYEARAKHHSTRQIITDALLALDGQPIHVPEGGFTMQDLQDALEGMRDMVADVVGRMLDERLDELASMAPAERRRSIQREVARSSYRSSILDSIDVADYDEDEDDE